MPGPPGDGGSNRAVAGFERTGGKAAVGAAAGVAGPVAVGGQRHAGVEVREVEPAAGEGDGGGAGGIEAEEKDAGAVVEGDVGADVEFEEGGKAGRAGEAIVPDVAHREGDDADPGLAVEGVEVEGGRDQGADRCGWQRPMGEEEVAPGHRHCRPAVGERPGAVVDPVEG